MSDWDRTRNGKEMMETIIRYLPRITVCLEEMAKRLDDKSTKSRKLTDQIGGNNNGKQLP